ncbi:MAG TPA: CBS domain-containing protein [Rhizomicrobium sp.]|jgi:CBS domain-containing protein
MTCSLMMTSDPRTVPESETVGEAARILVEHRYNNLPVVDANGAFVGMFGIYDLMSLLIPKVALAGGLMPNLRFMSDNPEELRATFREVSSRPIGEVAERDMPVLHPDTPEIEALRLFCRERTTLPVVERETKKLVGIVSYWDAVRAVTGLSREA